MKNQNVIIWNPAMKNTSFQQIPAFLTDQILKNKVDWTYWKFYTMHFFHLVLKYLTTYITSWNKNILIFNINK